MLAIEDLKIITSDLLTSIKKDKDDKYRFAYTDGVLDFFNLVKGKMEETKKCP